MIRAGIRRVLHLALRRRDRWECEVEDEIKLHLALRAEQLAAEGRDADEAYEEAIRRFGPLTESRARLLDAARHREERMQRTEFFGDLRQDIAFALRTLGRQKAWTGVTIFTLALGVGATTAVFSVVSTLLLHPLSHPHADRIVYVQLQPTQGNNTGISVTISPAAPQVRDWRRYSRSFEALEGDQLGPRALKTASGEPAFVSVESVLPTFLEFAGRSPLMGRMFTDADIANDRRVALLGEEFWRTRLGGNAGVLGQTITLRDSSFAIIGVMPAGLRVGGPGDRPADVWTPIDLRDDKAGMSLIGRLRPGVTKEAAVRELDSISARTSGFTKLPFKAVVTTPAENLRFRDSLVMLAAAVALVLLVACANVAHLLLARSATRQREMAIRAALGAGRSRLLRQLVTESLMLSLTGTALGVFVGWAGLRGIVAMSPRSLDSLRASHLDPTTLGIAVAVAMVSGLSFGLIGWAQSARHSTHDALKGGTLASSGARRQGRVRGLLVMSEMALSATLLVGSTLLVKSVIHLQRSDLGFDYRGLYALRLPLDGPAFRSDAAKAELVRAFVARVATMPRVQGVTVANVAPGGRWFSIGRLELEGEPAPAQAATAFFDVNYVAPSYFKVMGMSMVQGTTLTDTADGTHPVVVNAGFARQHWPDASAIGRRLRIPQTDAEPWMTIVGVVNDAKTSGPVAESSAPMFYSPLPARSAGPTVLIRTDGNAATLAPALGLLKQMGIQRVSPPRAVAETISGSIAGPRFIMMLLTIFTVLALVLAAVGLYGVMTYTVAQQTREIGIRVALGASEERIAGSVIARAASLAIAGATIGLGAAISGTRLIEHQLHGVSRLDPASFATGAGVLIGAALVACIVPTRRALSVDPMTAIRAD